MRRSPSTPERFVAVHGAALPPGHRPRLPFVSFCQNRADGGDASHRDQAELYRLLDHGAADLVAAALEDLAGECELLHAVRPDRVWDRRAAYEARSEAPATGRAIDQPERCTALAGHPDRLERPAGDVA